MMQVFSHPCHQCVNLHHDTFTAVGERGVAVGGKRDHGLGFTRFHVGDKHSIFFEECNGSLERLAVTPPLRPSQYHLLYLWQRRVFPAAACAHGGGDVQQLEDE